MIVRGAKIVVTPVARIVVTGACSAVRAVTLVPASPQVVPAVLVVPAAVSGVSFRVARGVSLGVISAVARVVISVVREVRAVARGGEVAVMAAVSRLSAARTRARITP